ncbi:MAG: hypothetical protein ABI193_03360, partial [Minicystis sp.]
PWVVACGVVTLGRLQSTLLSAAQSSFYAGTGARVGLVVPLLAERLSMGLTGDLLVNLTRPSTQLGGATVWSMAPVSGLLGLRLDAFF